MKWVKMMCVGLAALPLAVNAGDLKISNSTRYDFSFSFNNICSDMFGIAYSNSIKFVSEKQLDEACAQKPRQCIVNVFTEDNCKGEKLAEIGLDTRSGILYVGGPVSNPIAIQYTKFDLWFVSPVGKS